MLEQFEHLTEAQIRVKYSLLSEEEKTAFQQHILPLMNMLAKTMIAAGVNDCFRSDEVKDVEDNAKVWTAER
jgi:hypothetical protein